MMCWLAGNLTCRLLAWWCPLQRGDLVSSVTIDWCLAPHRWGFYITHSDAPQSVWLLWTRGQLVAETSTWQHTTLTTERHPCPRWDSNPQSQQASGRRLRPRGHWRRHISAIYVPIFVTIIQQPLNSPGCYRLFPLCMKAFADRKSR